MIASIREFLVRLWAFCFGARPNLLSRGIRAEVTIVLGDAGHVGIHYSKLQPGDDASYVYGYMLNKWLDRLSELGVALEWQTPRGEVIPLVVPASKRPITPTQPPSTEPVIEKTFEKNF